MMWFLRKKTPKELEETKIEIPFERRKFERVRNILTALCRKEGGHEQIKVFTDNVSEGGLKGVTQSEFAPEDKIHLSLLLHSIHTSITASGRVVWIRPLGRQQFEVGIEFTSIEMADRIRLKNYIDRYRIGVSGGDHI